jgi:hypothetical protein
VQGSLSSSVVEAEQSRPGLVLSLFPLKSFKFGMIVYYGLAVGSDSCHVVPNDSKFSNHRPVCVVFLAEVKTLNHCKAKKSLTSIGAKVKVEELLPWASCVEISFH